MNKVTDTTKKVPRRLAVEANPAETQTKILDAAFRQLATKGYASLSMREIAKDAGVNHALINYYFRSKDQLVIAVLDEANRQLLERQQEMYAGPSSFAAKWAQARRFYKDDVASGFVRVQAELWAASMSDGELREKFLPRLVAWRKLVTAGVRDALAALEKKGVKLPAPLTAEAIGVWICEFWFGMEFLDLIGGSRERAEHATALDAVGELLESLDALVQDTPRTRKRK